MVLHVLLGGRELGQVGVGGIRVRVERILHMIMIMKVSSFLYREEFKFLR